jgi:uncharacterized lipoprotein YmbA
MRLARRGLLGIGMLGTALTMAGCSSPNPTLYTIAVIPGPVRNGAPRGIALRTVTVPNYLQRDGIVRSAQGVRLDVLANDWWGEPLDAMLTRVLLQDLSQRLPASTVFSETGAVSANPDVTVSVGVQRLDQDNGGPVVLEAQVGVHGKRETVRSVRLTETPAGPDVASLVTAESRAWGQLADVVAGMVGG